MVTDPVTERALILVPVFQKLRLLLLKEKQGDMTESDQRSIALSLLKNTNKGIQFKQYPEFKYSQIL